MTAAAVRPSRRPRCGLLSMTFFLNSITSLPHPEEARSAVSKDDHDAVDSAQHPEFGALYQLKIDGGAETGAARSMNKPLAVDRDLLGEPVFLHRIGQQHLEQLGVPDRHDDVQVGDI